MNKVIVLLSSYNGEKYIEEQVSTVLNQEDVIVKLLIRDDGSRDSTIDIIKKLCLTNNNIELIEGINVGCAQSFLLLMKEALKREKEYDYISFCDQDDFWMKDKLKCAMEKLSLHNDERPFLYFSNLYIVDKELHNKRRMYDSIDCYLNKSHLLVENFATGCTMVFNKAALKSFLKYPIENLRVHDIRLFHMCLFIGDYYYDDTPHILYRQHSDNVIGANYYKKQRLKSKLRSLGTFWKQHVREEEAKELLRSYGEKISQEDKRLVEIVAFYRECLKYRLILFFAPGDYKFRLRRFSDNFWFRVRIILGAV